jgi:hypothetical protein
MILHLASIGYPITDAQQATPLYKACVKWCHNLTTKVNHNIEHRENATVNGLQMEPSLSTMSAANAIHPTYSPRKCTMALISAAFGTPSCLKLQQFLKGIYHSPDPVSTQPLAHSLDVAAQAAHNVPPSQPGLIKILLLHRSFRTLDALSCLSHAGRYILLRASHSGRLL